MQEEKVLMIEGKTTEKIVDAHIDEAMLPIQ
jgi:hypothetical protein